MLYRRYPLGRRRLIRRDAEQASGTSGAGFGAGDSGNQAQAAETVKIPFPNEAEIRSELGHAARRRHGSSILDLIFSQISLEEIILLGLIILLIEEGIEDDLLLVLLLFVLISGRE